MQPAATRNNFRSIKTANTHTHARTRVRARSDVISADPFPTVQVEINSLRDSFERGEDPLADVSDSSDINSAAGVLKLYLRELREPFFPTPYFDQFMEIARESSYTYFIIVI